MNYKKETSLYYDDSKDLYEGLIIEIDEGVQNQVALVYPAFRQTYGKLFAAAPEMYEALKAIYKVLLIADDPIEQKTILREVDQVYEALAKAEGK